MTESAMGLTAEGQMRCPTCGAQQAWSDECRRCRCDLSLLRQCRRACDAHRRQCLRHLAQGRPDRALRHARHYAALAGAAAAAPLVGVCLLLCQDWRAALVTAVNAP